MDCQWKSTFSLCNSLLQSNSLYTSQNEKQKQRKKEELTGFVEIPYDPSQHHRPNPRFLLYPHPRPRLPEPLRLRYEKGRTPRHYPHRRP